MDNKQYSTRELFAGLHLILKNIRFTLWMDLFCAALTTVCELVLPLIMRYITNEGLRDLASLSVRSYFHWEFCISDFVSWIASPVTICPIWDTSWARRSRRTCAEMHTTICRSCPILIIIIPKSVRSWGGSPMICLM